MDQASRKMSRGMSYHDCIRLIRQYFDFLATHTTPIDEQDWKDQPSIWPNDCFWPISALRSSIAGCQGEKLSKCHDRPLPTQSGHYGHGSAPWILRKSAPSFLSATMFQATVTDAKVSSNCRFARTRLAYQLDCLALKLFCEQPSFTCHVIPPIRTTYLPKVFVMVWEGQAPLLASRVSIASIIS